MNDANNTFSGPLDDTPRSLNRTILQLAAILIAAGVLLKLYQMQSQRGDDRAFGRLKHEVDTLEISPDGKQALRGVIDYAAELARQGRAATESAAANGDSTKSHTSG